MKLILFIKSFVFVLVLLVLVAIGMHTLLENNLSVDLYTLMGSFVGVELGMVILVTLLVGFGFGLLCGFILLGHHYFRAKRFEARLNRVEHSHSTQPEATQVT